MQVLEVIGNVLTDLVQNMQEFHTQLNNANAQLDEIILSCTDPTVDGGMMIRIFGAYRYIVGDKIFHTTYMLLLIGLGYSIYKIAILIKDNLFKTEWGKSIGTTIKNIFK